MGGVEPSTDDGGVEPGPDGEGIPTGLEGSAEPGAEGRGALGDEVGGAVTDGGPTELPLPGIAPGICCAMLGNASPSRLPSKSMPTSRKRYILPERLWNTASSSRPPDHAHVMPVCCSSFQREQSVLLPAHWNRGYIMYPIIECKARFSVIYKYIWLQMKK